MDVNKNGIVVSTAEDKGCTELPTVYVHYNTKENAEGEIVACNWLISITELNDFLSLPEDALICRVLYTEYHKSDLDAIDVMMNNELWLRLCRNTDGAFVKCPCSKTPQAVFELFFGGKSAYDMIVDKLWWGLFCEGEYVEKPAWYFLGKQSGSLYRVEADSDMVSLCYLCADLDAPSPAEVFKSDGLTVKPESGAPEDGIFECPGIKESDYYFFDRIDTPDRLVEFAFVRGKLEVYNLLELKLSSLEMDTLNWYCDRAPDESF